MRIIVLSLCLLFALQVQASFFSKILSKLWAPGLSHGGPVSGTSSPVQKDTAAENNKETSPVASSAVETERWTHMGHEPMNVEEIGSGLLLKKQRLDQHSLAEIVPRRRERPRASNQPRIEERSEIYRGSGSDIDFAVFMGYVIASHPGYVGHVGLRRAIDEGRLDIAVDLVRQDESIGAKGVEYVIGKDDLDLIANFINQTNQANTHTLKELFFFGSVETVRKVLEKVDFSQRDLVDVATTCNVEDYPETFLMMLNKIVTPEDQEKAVEKGIERLVDRDHATYLLLDALKGKTFRSERLEHLAIQKAFVAGVENERINLLPEDICSHPAITPALYADALIVTAEGWKFRMREFLLKRADRYDLEAVKEKTGYADLGSWFHDDIEEALKTAAPGGTRTRAYDVQSAEKTKKEFMEIGHAVAIPGIANIIGGYLTGEEPKQAAPQQGKAAVQRKKVETEEEEQGEVGEGEWETMEEVD